MLASQSHLAGLPLVKMSDLADLSETERADGAYVHAIGLLVETLTAGLARTSGIAPTVVRGPRIVPVADNYDRLYYPADGEARSPRYTHYLGEGLMLRTQMTALVPNALATLDQSRPEHLLILPGIVHRRDVVDRIHTGSPHQCDVWRISSGPSLGRADLIALVETIARTLLGYDPELRYNETGHPYTLGGLEVELHIKDAGGDRWLEILECGLARPQLLADAGLDPARWSGLAVGMGLDRLAMLRKGLDDIRLLRDPDPRIAAQMRNLAPYIPVSRQPNIKRDLSIVVPAERSVEDLTETAMNAAGEQARLIESLEVVARYDYSQVPQIARERLGLGVGQDNRLVRITLSDPGRALRRQEANGLYDRLYNVLHEGSAPGYAR